MTEDKKPDYMRFEPSAWSALGKALLYEKESPERQQDFLRACRSGNADFLNYVYEMLSAKAVNNGVVGEDEFVFNLQLTEQEFRQPPADTQERIWNEFDQCEKETLSDCGFWGYVICRMIERGNLQSTYLATGLGNNSDGVTTIDEALRGDNKRVDVCTRRILRSMCNPEPRGKRILFFDFYLGKIYWRWYWAEKMSPVIPLTPEQIRGVLNLDYFQELSAHMHSGRSCISVANVFGGLLLYLQTKSEKVTGQKLRAIVDKIAYLSAWKAIEAQSPETNKDEIANLA